MAVGVCKIGIRSARKVLLFLVVLLARVLLGSLSLLPRIRRARGVFYFGLGDVNRRQHALCAHSAVLSAHGFYCALTVPYCQRTDFTVRSQYRTVSARFLSKDTSRHRNPSSAAQRAYPSSRARSMPWR
ncbi:hypothetical protein B0T16DRAFT_9575 [Cercophora newfieldiana]|uniref:Uncharacterized protein n=1 Tax=Cercophora newfieldiana TaxID=92897 RepID=A0AA39YPG6_9PEZI|nr:hypothetical protein B0T16DRAFT_9575 [Cercophora newfieldiana]